VFHYQNGKGAAAQTSKPWQSTELCVEDQLLTMLMYNREYRTFMHIAADYGISEAQCWRIIPDIENILIQSNAFSLPGKKALTKSTVK
jgi:Helix-turn-helix of DDE superfamily endonuclease